MNDFKQVFKKLRKCLRPLLLGIIGILLSLSFTAKAQDIHFTQFYAAPVQLNPAMAGLFDGDVRFTGNYRSQWGSFVPAYRTIVGSVDMPLLNVFSTNDVIAGGLSFYSDQAGQAKLTTNHISLSVAYLKSLSTTNDHYLSIGIQSNYAQRSLDVSALTFDEEFDGGNPETITSEQASYLGFSPGIVWYYLKDENLHFYAGAAAFQLNQPSVNGFSGIQDQLPARWAMNAGGMIGIKDKIAVLPSVLFQQQAQAREVSVGGYLRYQLTESTEGFTGIYLGGWYRIGDGIAPSIRIDWKELQLGLSYDINTSSLQTVSQNRGGTELSLVYKADWKGKSGDGRKLVLPDCPRF